MANSAPSPGEMKVGIVNSNDDDMRSKVLPTSAVDAFITATRGIIGTDPEGTKTQLLARVQSLVGIGYLFETDEWAFSVYCARYPADGLTTAELMAIRLEILGY